LVEGAAYWPYFAKHHYMSGDYNGHGAIVGVMNGELAAFTSHIAYPSPIPQPCKREHRTVVLPDFQGFGLGPQVSQVMGVYLLSQGFRYFCKTSHHRLGEHRNRSPLWKATSWNGKGGERDNQDRQVRWHRKMLVGYCHEFVGDDPELYASVMEMKKRGDANQISLFPIDSI
jgi:hypothetical protein